MKKQLNRVVDLSIIIVNFNTEDLLLDCVASINGSLLGRKLNVEVIVVDNCSTDGSVEALKREYPDAVLIENKENLGFSRANNRGIKKAKGRYILFLNSDTIVYRNTLETMVEFMDENPKTGAATCKVLLPNGKLDDASHRGFPTPWNSFSHFSGLSKIPLKLKILDGYNLGYLNKDKVHEIDACAGAFMIVRREAGEKIGWWDEDYFWYGDDLDLCFRLKKKGWKIYFVPDVSILHYKGASGGIKKISKDISLADMQTKKLATKARFNAMRIFYNKHYKKNYPWYINSLVSSGISFRQQLSSF